MAIFPDPSTKPACAIVVINMDRDPDRLAYIRTQLERLGLPFERFAAIAGSNLPADLLNYFPANPDGTRFLSNGEVGCYASHLAVYQAIADGRIAAPALVLEDDVELPPDLNELLARSLSALPSDWDFVRLSSPAKRAYVTLAPLPGERALVRYSVSPGSNGALLVSQAGARKFLDPQPRRLPIDQDNRLLWRFNLHLYGIAPAPIRGNALQTSTIDDLAAGRSREDKARQRSLRAQREMGRRHAWTMREMGVAGWAASEAVNLVAPFIGKRKRPRFLARAGVWLGTIARPPAA